MQKKCIKKLIRYMKFSYSLYSSVIKLHITK